MGLRGDRLGLIVSHHVPLSPLAGALAVFLACSILVGFGSAVASVAHAAASAAAAREKQFRPDRFTPYLDGWSAAAAAGAGVACILSALLVFASCFVGGLGMILNSDRMLTEADMQHLRAAEWAANR